MMMGKGRKGSGGGGVELNGPTRIRGSSVDIGGTKRAESSVSTVKAHEGDEHAPFIEPGSFAAWTIDLCRGSHGAHRICPVGRSGVGCRQIRRYDYRFFVIFLRKTNLLHSH